MAQNRQEMRCWRMQSRSGKGNLKLRSCEWLRLAASSGTAVFENAASGIKCHPTSLLTQAPTFPSVHLQPRRKK